MAFPTQTTLNGFSAALRDLVRDCDGGSKGTPMVLDGNWKAYRTVKMRYADLCAEFDLEPGRGQHRFRGLVDALQQHDSSPGGAHPVATTSGSSNRPAVRLTGPSSVISTSLS